MAFPVSYEEARKHRFQYVNTGGDTGWLNHYLGQMKNAFGKNPAFDLAEKGRSVFQVSDEIYPVAFQVEQDPEQVLDLHFHQADQFQVVLPCDGKFGKTPVDRPIVHFAAACSAYGPLTSGTQVLKYFTLRNGWDEGALMLAQHRPESFRRGRKPRSAHAAVPAGADHAASSIEVQPLIALDASGLFATHFNLPAHTDLKMPDPGSGRGQYWLVLSGSCTVQGRELGAQSIWFVKPEESAGTVRGGAQGARLIAMQFPRLPDGPAPA